MKKTPGSGGKFLVSATTVSTRRYLHFYGNSFFLNPIAFSLYKTLQYTSNAGGFIFNFTSEFQDGLKKLFGTPATPIIEKFSKFSKNKIIQLKTGSGKIEYGIFQKILIDGDYIFENNHLIIPVRIYYNPVEFSEDGNFHILSTGEKPVDVIDVAGADDLTAVVAIVGGLISLLTIMLPFIISFASTVYFSKTRMTDGENDTPVAISINGDSKIEIEKGKSKVIFVSGNQGMITCSYVSSNLDFSVFTMTLKAKDIGTGKIVLTDGTNTATLNVTVVEPTTPTTPTPTTPTPTNPTPTNRSDIIKYGIIGTFLFTIFFLFKRK